MSCDRFIYFGFKSMPSEQDVQHVIEDYLGDALVGIDWGGKRWTARIDGNKSWPLRRVLAVSSDRERVLHDTAELESTEERWIEVFIGDDNIDVITRRQDEYTMAVADGLAKLMARFWRGRLEME